MATCRSKRPPAALPRPAGARAAKPGPDQPQSPAAGDAQAAQPARPARSPGPEQRSMALSGCEPTPHRTPWPAANPAAAGDIFLSTRSAVLKPALGHLRIRS